MSNAQLCCKFASTPPPDRFNHPNAMANMDSVPQMPTMIPEFIPEPIDTTDDEMHDTPSELISQLSEHLAIEFDETTITAAAAVASKLLKTLKSRERSIKKKAKKAAAPPKERAAHGTKIPSMAAIFAKDNSEIAAKWYADGGRVPDFNLARGAQTAKYLALLWRDVPDTVRDMYKTKRDAIIADRASATDMANVIHQAIVNPGGEIQDPVCPVV
uniref:Uncharacterized protein n=1 Tax=viral metagenome TaxID=1070528 RepID=A0A6C0LRK8_9ZZZZ